MKHIVEVEEISIKVPWGHIAAKWWGSQQIRPIVMLHGWQDNAGTFDALIPLLPTHISYLAIDLPGHGLSSHLPNGMMYNLCCYIYVLRLVHKKFNWEKISLCAHSMGATISFVYASSFPKECDMVVALDALKPIEVNNDQVLDFYRNGLNEIYVSDERNIAGTEPPSYTYQNIVEKLLYGVFSSYTEESLPYLLVRGIKESKSKPRKYFFSRDNRVKTRDFLAVPPELNVDMASQIKAAYCFIKALQCQFGPKGEYVDEILRTMKESNPKFELHGVDGDHHVHLTEPEKVEELSIKVPWGYIAAKWWGPRHIRPIVMVHGWQDNAGTFDTLILLLPRHVSYLAIDLPGHGISTHLPHGMLYSQLCYISVIRWIHKQFNWEKISLCGHSLGAIISFVYASSFPNECDMVIALDALKPLEVIDYLLLDFYRNGLNDIYVSDQRNIAGTEPPSYSYETVLEKLMNGVFSSYTKESLPYLLVRGIKESKSNPNKYFFTRDNRVKTGHILAVPIESNVEMATRITAPYCYINALKYNFNIQRAYMDEILHTMRNSNPQFEIHGVDGDHHVHLTEPKKVCRIISRFIEKHRPITLFSKL